MTGRRLPWINGKHHDPNPAWRAQAACRDMDPDDFYPERGDPAGIERALAVCSGCPSVEPCLAFALNTGEWDGVWGGTTGKQRQKMGRGRGAIGRPPLAPHGTRSCYARGCRCVECTVANREYHRTQNHNRMRAV